MRTSLLLLMLGLMATISASSQNLVSVNPSQGQQGQSLSVIISGQSTHFNQGTATSVWFSQGSTTLFPLSYLPLSATQLQAQFDLSYSQPTGYYQANVYHGPDGLMVLPNAFLLLPGNNPPSLLSVNPGTGQQGQSLNLTISGQNTHFTQGTGTMTWFSQGTSTLIYPNFVTTNNNTQLQAQFDFDYTHPTGYYQANSYNTLDGLLTLPNSFLLQAGGNPPAIVMVNPAAAYLGQALNVTVSGQNTHFQQSSTTVYYDLLGYQVHPYTTTTLSNTQLQTLIIPPYSFPSGFYNTRVMNPIDGLMSLPSSLNLQTSPFTPAITNITPDSVLAAAAVTFTFTGVNTNFLYAPYHYAMLDGPSFFTSTTPSVINNNLLNMTFNLLGAQSGYYNVQLFNEIDGYLLYSGSVYVNQGAISVEERQVVDLLIFPNPATRYIYLLPASSERIQEVHLYNTMGKKVLSGQASHPELPQRVDLEGLLPGVYFVEVHIAGQRLVKKLIRQ